ncbi:MAG: hypothetical protein AB7S39_08835 [Gemmatimonadales bacterium]
MSSERLVELADRYSRRRALIAVVAGAAFLGVQLVAQPRVFRPEGEGGRLDLWVVNAIALLGVLATGGGVLTPRRVQALVQDELARVHLQVAVRVGYWVAMGLALLLYLGPWFRGYSARQAVYVIVTGSVVGALFTFAGLERRAHADA